MSESARDRIFPFEVKENNRIALVAGGAGFLGSFICEQLISQGFYLYCVDNLTSGSKDNIKHLLDNQHFNFVKADINSPSFNIPSDIKVDVIFHAAGLEEFSASKELSLETLMVNSLGTRVLLELAKSRNSKFVFVSSAELYSGVFSSTSLKYYFGKDARSESTFTHNEAKRFAEALVFEYFKNYDLFAVIARVKDVYGPKMNFNAEGDVNGLLADATSGRKLTISGDGLRSVNPTYVADVSSGVVKAGVFGAKGEIYNIVNPEKSTLNAFAQTIQQVVGNLEVVHKRESDDFDIPYHQPDVSTSFEKLNWRPIVSLADGIAFTINYFKQLGNEPEERTTQPIFKETPNSLSKKKNRSIFTFLRIIIFLAAFALVIITTVYPAGALVYNTYRANQDFDEAIKNLEADRVIVSSQKAKGAQASYKMAAADLQNLDWLMSILIDRERLNALYDFYFVGEKFSNSLINTSLALDILIEVSTEPILSEEGKVTSGLEEISNLTSQAKEEFDLGSAALSEINKEKVPSSLKDNFDDLVRVETILREVLEELLGSTDT